MTIERRHTLQQQHRPSIAKRADGRSVITGYAAVFYRQGEPGTEYKLWAGLVERIMPGAFDRAVRENQDVRGLFNHNSSALLGRTASGTMRLAVDHVGLRYEIDVDDTQLCKDLAIKLDRGDITGSSFGFIIRKVSYTSVDDSTDIRGVEDVDLYDCGPVTYPAYEATSASIRNAEPEAAKAEWEEWRAQHRGTKRHDADAVEVRRQLLRLQD